MITKMPSPVPGKVRIQFRVPGSLWAERINLVGDFNNWNPDSLPFMLGSDDDWRITLDLEAGKSYRFRYLFDGVHWRDEWQADTHEPNPHGGFDSVVIATLE